MNSRVRADYGIDAPGVVRRLALGGLAATGAGIGLIFVGGWISGLAFAVAFCLLVTACGMVFSSKVLKLRERDRLLDLIDWRGDERVLDVGCGRGLLLIGAAKRLTTGRAVGVDIWSTRDQSGNSPEATRANARAEGVADLVEIVDGDARKLPFENGEFDVVVSSLVIHNVPGTIGRDRAIHEIVRVLKPGGSVALVDLLHTRRYARLFRDSGLEDVRWERPRFLFSAPTRRVRARKPHPTG